MSDKNIEKYRARLKRKMHIKKVVHGTKDKPRLVVYRSLKNTIAQLVDDEQMHTLAYCATNSPAAVEKMKEAKNRVNAAFLLGQLIGGIAREKGIDKAVFDRNGYLYHGRVKAVAEGARKAGLKI
jgi:large subunit ribosomal protein L18